MGKSLLPPKVRYVHLLHEHMSSGACECMHTSMFEYVYDVCVYAHTQARGQYQVLLLRSHSLCLLRQRLSMACGSI